MSETDQKMLTHASHLLDTYATGLPGWKRFFTGNNSDAALLYPFNRMWGRHHLPEVNRIRTDLHGSSHAPVQNIVDLLHRLHSIVLLNHRGSLAKRINGIWQRVLHEENLSLLTQEVEDRDTCLSNGLMLVMQHRPHALDRMLRCVLDMSAHQKKISLLKHALSFAMGEHREVRHPVTGELRLEDWHYLPQATELMDQLHVLHFSDRKTILLFGLLRAWECNRLDSYEEILGHLFHKYSRPPSQDYLTWIRVVLSSRVKTAEEDNTGPLLAAIHRAIGETSMYVPTSFQADRRIIQRILKKEARTGSYLHMLFRESPVATETVVLPQDEDEEIVSIVPC